MGPSSDPTDLLERMVLAVNRVEDRLRRAAIALTDNQIPFAITGDLATSVWIAGIDPSAVRQTPSVELLILERDLESVATALIKAGFHRQSNARTELFFDGVQSRPRDAVRMEVLRFEETVKDIALLPWAAMLPNHQWPVHSLEQLVAVQLSRFKRNDQVNLRDMLGVGLINESWKTRFPPELADRLQHLIDTPEN